MLEKQSPTSGRGDRAVTPAGAQPQERRLRRPRDKAGTSETCRGSVAQNYSIMHSFMHSFIQPMLPQCPPSFLSS